MAQINTPQYAKVEAFYEAVSRLSATSSDKDFEEVGQFFDKDAVAFLLSMREFEKPSKGPEGIVAGIRENLKSIKIVDRKVLSSSASPDGRILFVETRQRLEVCGEFVDPHFETALFNFTTDGLIVGLKLYSCWSPIVKLIQLKTGFGPYHSEELVNPTPGVVSKPVAATEAKGCCD